MQGGFGGFGARRNMMNQSMPVPAAALADMELLPTLEYLMLQGSTFDIRDSKQRDVMSYAIENNDLALVKFLISHAAIGKLMIDSQDKDGKSAVHYVVNPVGYGSYMNITILEELRKAGYRLDLKDKEGMTPLDYAND
jgi:predicted DNA-binding WGR domain protein